MTTTLYYTVEKQLQNTADEIEETTGWKTICVYEIANDRPKSWFETEAPNEDDSEQVIKNWLKDNGFGNRDYKFEQL